MLYIILNILKIVGIIVLSLLAFILVLLIALLFVPVRYGFNAYKPDIDSGFDVRFQLSWLLKLFALCFRYKSDDEGKLYLRIFGIKKHLNQDKDNTKEKEKRQKKHHRSKGEDADADYVLSNGSVSQELKKEYNDKYGDNSNRGEEETLLLESPDLKKENSILVRIKNIFAKIKNILKKIKSAVTHLSDTFESAKNKVGRLYSFASDGNNKKGMKKVLSSVTEILKKIKPKFKASVHFGFDDPYKMGQILSVLGILYPLYAKSTEVYPEFDNGDFYYGNVAMKGKIRLFTLLLICFKLYRDKNFKYLYNNYKQIKA